MKNPLKSHDHLDRARRVIDLDGLMAHFGLRKQLTASYAPQNLAIAATGLGLLGGGILGAVQPRRTPLLLQIPTDPHSERAFVKGYNRVVENVATTPRIRRLIAVAEIVAGLGFAYGFYRAVRR